MPRSPLRATPALLVCTAALLAAALLGLAACSNTADTLPNADLPGTAEDAPAPEAIVSGIGTVRYVELEGGFYGLVASDSARYLPQNLEEAYREDGLRVRFRAARQDSVMTAQMWGQPVEILDMMPMNDQ